LKISVVEAIWQFESASRSDLFAEYQKDFAKHLTSALSREYLKGEVKSVRTIEKFVNSVHSLKKRGMGVYGMPFELLTNSIFIHGNKSQVEFDYYGQKNGSIELGDLIFISTVVFERKKYFEKMTINQFKIDSKRKRAIYWTINNKKQLYLLSRFPTFRPVRGIIPRKEYNLPNQSGCLGSYGLLYRPGDFAFISATRLDSLIGSQRTIRQDELSEHFSGSGRCSLACCPVLGDCHLCLDLYSFTNHYLRLNIGEPVFAKEGSYNRQAKSLFNDLIVALQRAAKKEKPDQRIIRFLEFFRRFPYTDDSEQDTFTKNSDSPINNGGIGIIHTTIMLGE
jgi:hypothetical protein